MANARQAALAKARQRRVALDRDRAARDGRIEAAAAEVFVQQQARFEAEQAVARADVAIGAALRRLLEDGVAVEGVAQLCELSETEVRRLVRTRARVDPAQDDQNAGQDGEQGVDQDQQRANVTELHRGGNPAGRAATDVGQSDEGHAARRAE